MSRLLANKMSSDNKLDQDLKKLLQTAGINSKTDSFNNRFNLTKKKMNTKSKKMESGLVTETEADMVSGLTGRIEDLEKIQINCENKMITQDLQAVLFYLQLKNYCS